MSDETRRVTIRWWEVAIVLFMLLMLLSLFIPSIQHGGGGRRNTCSSNMRQCALALIQQAEIKRQFPGYANLVGKQRASWIVPILPNLERADLYRTWVEAKQPTAEYGDDTDLGRSRWVSQMSFLVCPSDSDRFDSSPDPLSYVINTGSARTANDFLPQLGHTNWVEDINSGVFFNHAREPADEPFAVGAVPRTTLESLSSHDGTSNTLMMSENLQATNWATDPLDPMSTRPFDSEFQIRQATGFVWFVTGEPNNQMADLKTASYRAFDWQSVRINARSQEVKTPIRRAYDERSAPARTGGLAACRPSSNHPGGVNTYFCDGHYRFLSDEIDYRVYCQLMSPNDRDVVIAIDPNGQPVTAAQSQPDWDRWIVPVSENDY